MIEIVREEEGVSDKPECWNLPEKRSYWACLGHDELPKRKWFHRHVTKEPAWRCLLYTKEEAEAHASIPDSTWEWDKQPAQSIEVAEVLNRARINGDLGVCITSYQNGKWVTVKQYPCGVPLPEWELE